MASFKNEYDVKICQVTSPIKIKYVEVFKNKLNTIEFAIDIDNSVLLHKTQVTVNGSSFSGSKNIIERVMEYCKLFTLEERYRIWTELNENFPKIDSV